jgi:ribosome-associated protein
VKAKKAAPKKKAVKKIAVKKAAVKKATVKKIVKKAAPKKVAAKKQPAKKVIAKKAVAKKVVKKAAVKKSVSKKAVKKAAAKKLVKKAAPEKVAAKKLVKKAAPKKFAPKKAIKKPAPKKVAPKKAVKKAVKTSSPKTLVQIVPKGPRYEGPVWPLMDVILNALDDAKAEETIAFNIQGRSSMADGMVVASGRVNRHVAAISDQVVQKLKSMGQKDIRVEGLQTADWVLVDAGDIIVHIMRPEVRSFYNLEKLWSKDAPQEQRE